MSKPPDACADKYTYTQSGELNLLIYEEDSFHCGVDSNHRGCGDPRRVCDHRGPIPMGRGGHMEHDRTSDLVVLPRTSRALRRLVRLGF